jgi:aminobenzoyl-glutamate transport protein
VPFAELDPRNGEPIRIVNLLDGAALTAFASKMVSTFVSFPPLGVVLVAMLGLGVAEHTGFISAALRTVLAITPRVLLTPVLVAVGVLSHVAVDAGYVLVIPLGAVIFFAAGRHPLAGIAAAFAGVSGGFSATFVPSSLDPLLAGITQVAAQITDPTVTINPLNNYFFTTASTGAHRARGLGLTDLVIEPRLRGTAIDGDPSALPTMDPLTTRETRGRALGHRVDGASRWRCSCSPPCSDASPWRAPADAVPAGGNALLVSAAPLMQSIVPIIFVFFLVPGVVYGYVAGTVKSHRDVVAGMSKAMSGMGYYVVMAFFCAQFIYAFGQSNLGALLAIKGANWLKLMGFPMGVTWWASCSSRDR